ncbi:MAG: UDP-N-acetylglucosamine 2-epimerase (non-hydrolyzing) [Acidobacteriaceae bacterium]
MQKFLHVVGARPNFMKVAPVYRSLAARGASQVLVHTGQHYDVNMSDVFFRELEIPAADINLQVGSGSHAQQTAEIMQRFEPVVLEQGPDCVVVYGDVNSTVAAGLVCAKLLVPIAHVEAGLRSGDRTMPEEINRLLTDQLAGLLFTPSIDGDVNLAKEGIPASRIHFVGNVMIDTLVRMLPAARRITMADVPEKFILVTLHRPSNVDDIAWLTQAIALLNDLSRRTPVVFPIHPRTRQRLESTGLKLEANPRLIFSQPKPYLEFLALQTRATAVVTDSGGIQEETTYLKVPCITVRENTERPVTVEQGSNVLVGRDLNRLREELNKVLAGDRKATSIPDLWDGHAAERIAKVLISVDSR